MNITGLDLKEILDQYREVIANAERGFNNKIAKAAIDYGVTLERCRENYEAQLESARNGLRVEIARAREKYDEGVKHEAKENRSESYQGSRGEGNR